MFYETAYGDSTQIKRGIGDIQKATALIYMEQNYESIPNVSQVQQMFLLGDPAVKLFGARKPDYAIADTELYTSAFDGNPITAQTDSFALNIIVKNYGIAKGDTLHVRVTRTFNDNSTKVYDTLFAPVLYADTLLFVVRKEPGKIDGSNTFQVEIDPTKRLNELTHANNIATLGVNVPINGTRNLFPFDHSIVHTTAVDLRFQATDIFSGEREFILEVDTLQTFDSPFKKEFAPHGNVLVKEPLPLLNQDSLVYYWRTKLANPKAGESEEWTWSSFVYIKDGPDGWAQMHFNQYLKNEAEGLIRDTGARELRFEETKTSVAISTIGGANPANNLAVSIKLNGAEYQLKFSSVTERVPCRKNTINIIAFDKTTTVPYPAIDFGFSDPRTCGKEPQVIGSFATSELEIANYGIGDYIDKIKTGDSVVVFSIGDAGYASWSPAVKSKLTILGISTAQINSLQAGEPVVIFGKKKSVAGSAIVHTTTESPANQQTLTATGTITGRYTFGNMKSALIGPAAEWKSLVHHVTKSEPSDVATVSVYGITLKGKEELLFDNVQTTISLSTVDATTYPYLKLLYHAEDAVTLTAPQLNKWLVAYTPVAEGLLIFNGTATRVDLVEGEKWDGSFGFVNISDRSFTDSLLVQQEFFNQTTRSTWAASYRIKAPEPSDTTRFTAAFDSFNKSGYNSLNVSVNPRVLPEQYYENNSVTMPNYLYVQPDVFAPVLQVTIDGRQVRDGDYVSPTPAILIKLWDENKFIHKTDTANMKMFLRYPCSLETCPFKQIYFSQSTVVWKPATDSTDFNVILKPSKLPEGNYTLRIEGADARNNAAAAEPYELSFIVDYESSFVFNAPHPNPSHGDVTFSFILSGESAPDHLSIEVFSVDGKLVRELTKENAFFVGTNEIVWDGRNSQGEPLPNGLYVYKLTVQKDGEVVTPTTTAGGHYLRNGYGKIVIVR